MGREVRRVPADWQHPRDERGHYRPLRDRSFRAAAAEWKTGFLQWEAGFRKNWFDEADPWKPRAGEELELEYWEWSGDPPERDDYRPDWPEETRTHYQMYETGSEGTPISPVCATPEELARWLADHGASACPDRTASYEQWLRVCRGGYAPSLVIDGQGIRSGVEL